MNIVVLAGGTSTERDISIMTSVKVCESLRRNGHNANIIDVFFGIEDKAAETFFNDNGNDLEKIAADMKKKDILVDLEEDDDIDFAEDAELNDLQMDDDIDVEDL